MSQDSKIEWCDHTFNPWEGCTKVSPGCTKVSPGCANCYAEARNARFGGGTAPNWGKGAPRRRTSAFNWGLPLKWYNQPKPGELIKVFCASLADWLDPEVPIEWLVDLLDLMQRTPSHLVWMMLTKRPELWRDRLSDAVEAATDVDLGWVANWLDGDTPANVWVGTSVEDQRRADERIPHLYRIPARVRFLSCEPLVGPVSLTSVPYGTGDALAHLQDDARLDWVIIGGESGRKARPCVVEYVDRLRRECVMAGIACFVKQLGSYCVTSNVNRYDWPDRAVLTEWEESPYVTGGRYHLTDAKGGNPADWPEQLRVRQFPTL